MVKNNSSQKDAARLINCTANYISKSEQRILMRYETIMKFADVYGFSLEEYKEIALKELEKRFNENINKI